jgi:AcrR family transcriptional regulator
MSEEPVASDVPERLIQATATLLAEQGPSAIKARTVAAQTGMSTMVVYSHFGGIAELLNAVVDSGFNELEQTFARIAFTEDPIADLFAMALATREVARANPHLYDAMFGLSNRASYRAMPDSKIRLSGHSPAFQAAYAHVTEACVRLAESGEVQVANTDAMAAALWSFVHGYITLELANHFTEFEDPVEQVLMPMGIAFTVGIGADRERSTASHQAALTASRQNQ